MCNQNLKDVGAFQWCCILAFGLASGVAYQTNVGIILIAPHLDFYCNDESASFRGLNSSEQERLMTPFGRCYRPDMAFTNYSTIDLQTLNTSSVGSRRCDTGYVYDHSKYDYTVTEQYSLVCDRKWMISMAKTTYMLGYFVGALGSGIIADKVGWKTTVVVAGIFVAIFNACSAFCPTAEVFLFVRFLTACVRISYVTIGQTLAIELVRVEDRKLPRTMVMILAKTMLSIFVAISFVLRDHRFLQLYTASTVMIMNIVLWFVLPESPRWLASQDRMDEAKAIARRIAKFNKWSYEKVEFLAPPPHDDVKKSSIIDVFKFPVMRKRMLLLCAHWFALIMTYYAIAFNLGSFYPDLRISLLVASAIEMPFIIVPYTLVDVLGRPLLSTILISLAGSSCLGMIPFMWTPGGSSGLLVLALMGKCFTLNQFQVTYIYTPELMPTVVRSQGLGLASTFGRVGGMIAPQIALLDDLWPATSVTILGSLALVAAALCPLTPDTTGVELPQTLEQGEKFQPDHSYELQRPRKDLPRQAEELRQRINTKQVSELDADQT